VLNLKKLITVEKKGSKTITEYSQKSRPLNKKFEGIKK